ncbi:hypothetical protein K9M09_00450 [Patescibacteria group bacterium]|nr:hypothetical protein [Patescibacteria group bacterium]
MKKFLVSQTVGLSWFIIVYALVRGLIAGPLSIQGVDTFALVITVSVLMWLLLSIINSEKKAFGLSSSLFAAAATLFVLDFFRADNYDDYVWYALIVVLVISLLSFVILGIYRKMTASHWLIASGRVLLTLALVVVIEFLVLPLIPIPTP